MNTNNVMTLDGKLSSRKKFHQKKYSDSGFEKAYILQGEIFFSLNCLTEALSAFDKALLVNPENTKALACKAQIYDMQNINEKALECINLAISYTNKNDTEFLASLFDQKLDILNKINDRNSIISTLIVAQKVLPCNDYSYLHSFYENKPNLIAL